jgi:hypothetical protein
VATDVRMLPSFAPRLYFIFFISIAFFRVLPLACHYLHQSYVRVQSKARSLWVSPIATMVQCPAEAPRNKFGLTMFASFEFSTARTASEYSTQVSCGSTTDLNHEQRHCNMSALEFGGHWCPYVPRNEWA